MNAVVESSSVLEQRAFQIHPVILAGGSGTRLWPLSRTAYPKQLLPLVTERSLLQQTVERNQATLGFAAPVLVCGDEHRFLVDDQMAAIGVEPQQIILEPVGRNTAPALAVAALLLSDRDQDALMLVQPADHAIGDLASLQAAVRAGLPAAEEGRLVTFGITPDRPEPGYGYIKGGPLLEGSDHVRIVDRFIEKPDRNTAKAYVDSGAYFWNSGIFLMRANRYLEELRRLHPAVLEACEQAVLGGQSDLGFYRLDAEAFRAAASLSIDHAVMERADRAAVVPVSMAWSDLGSWQALRSVLPDDGAGNILSGDVIARDVRNCYLRSEDKLLAVIGLEDVVVVSTDDAVLVARADRVDEVSQVVEQLRLRNRPEPLSHRTCYRPWGSYASIDMGDRFQVKRITVKPGARLSLQKHFHRAEHWVVVRGTALVERDGESMLLRENESIYIPIGAAHRLENPGKLPLHLIEVQSGAYLGEDDIVRLADNYGRC
ncbi:mannose-1-phosphate guanylyltransferase/mannose-6-phosphate isomerase [Ferrovibrio sp.]|uniref:mannose-1-phosphate guanylyltransferase/mannose-6-phosphate isomerase n=1 Tax=Ferrovibrio sp. TaxID=1917215 RepID=UPI00262B0240|nr:mannose-1-phosphate guanylyltransferase/mannose-6-phosphate isomerase [Ferrovibrio sp.]